MENINERTKEELIEEIENLQEEVKKRDKYSKYDAAAEELAAVRDAMVKHGFTEEQAVQIMIMAASNTFRR